MSIESAFVKAAPGESELADLTLDESGSVISCSKTPLKSPFLAVSISTRPSRGNAQTPGAAKSSSSKMQPQPELFFEEDIVGANKSRVSYYGLFITLPFMEHFLRQRFRQKLF